jgi:hypothetical protein
MWCMMILQPNGPCIIPFARYMGEFLSLKEQAYTNVIIPLFKLWIRYFCLD